MKKALILTVVLPVLFRCAGACAISAKSAIVIDGKTGRVLYEKSAYEKLPMASTTKIMTGLIACEKGKMKSTVKVSPNASGTEGSSIWLGIGEKISFRDLCYGLMLQSGNDAAVAIAEHIAGSTDAFVLLMNNRAKEIGAENTSFATVNGLDDENHYTTAYDLAIISAAAMKNACFREIVSTKEKIISWEGHPYKRHLHNHNKMLSRYSGCIGIKTGFTKKSGRCLVTCAQRDGMELICVTLNAPDDWNDHARLLDSAFKAYKSKRIFTKDERAAEYKLNSSKSIPLYSNNNVDIVVAEGESVTTKIYRKKHKLPIKKNTVLATADIFIDGKKVTTVQLRCRDDVKKSFWEW